MRIRGLLADPARLVENIEHYRRLIDFCAAWKLNTLLFRVTDDQGSALRFASHPELLTHHSAFTPEEVRGLAEYGRERGVDLIPEIESFGHSWYITHAEAYRHLLDDAGQKPGFGGFTPLHPDAIKLMEDLYREVAAIFPSRYLHGGCDEVSWGNSEFSRGLLKDATRPQAWARWLNTLSRIARDNGKELMVWADHMLRGEMDCLADLDKSIALVDWDYMTTDAEDVERHARRALAAGLRVIGAPALGWSRWGPRVNGRQRDNIHAFTDAYRRIGDDRAPGIILTHWCPTRFIQNSQWDGLAHGAASMVEGLHWARQNALRQYVQQHFGADFDSHWKLALEGLMEAPLPIFGRGGTEWRQFLAPVWASDYELLRLAELSSVGCDAFTAIRAELARCAPTIRRNWADFQALELVVRYLEHIHWRCQVVMDAATASTTEPDAAELIVNLAERDADLWAALQADWKATRDRSAEFLTQSMPGMGRSDQLHYGFQGAAEYSAELARDPARFAALLGQLRESVIVVSQRPKPASH